MNSVQQRFCFQDPAGVAKNMLAVIQGTAGTGASDRFQESNGTCTDRMQGRTGGASQGGCSRSSVTEGVAYRAARRRGRGRVRALLAAIVSIISAMGGKLHAK